MKAILSKAHPGITPLVIRLFLAVVLFPHGAQKLFGWFDGYGVAGTMQYLTQDVGLPWFVGFAVIIIEFFGPMFLVFGLATRFWSLAITCVMVGIILTNFTDYFFMNWYGNQKTEGMEFFLLAIGMSVSLIVSGAGKHSIDESSKNLIKNVQATQLG